jgi:endonuclease YncB( thermonuclease family)
MRFSAAATLLVAVTSMCIAAEPIGESLDALELCIQDGSASGCGVAGAVITGKARAKDGDSILIGEGRGTVDVRLHGIDAPEWDQDCRDHEGKSWPCGAEAKAQLAKLVNGKLMRCDVTDIEKGAGKRPIVRCFHGAINISEAMLRNGLAWVFDRYADKFGDYSTLKAIEAEAKSKKRGMWQGDGEPEAPWLYREQRWERYATRAPNGCPIIGNPKSKVYHTPWSRNYDRTFEKAIAGARDWIWFCNDDETTAAGFRLAGGSKIRRRNATSVRDYPGPTALDHKPVGR